MNNNKNRVYKVISRILEIDINLINDKTGPDNVSSWDSFNALMLISEFEEEFNISFTLEEVSDVKDVKDILKVMEKHGVEFDDK